MIEDIEGRIIEVGKRYGLGVFESLYLFDSLVHMGYDVMSHGVCGFVGGGIKVGNSLVNFISYVDSGLVGFKEYCRLLRCSYGVVRRRGYYRYRSYYKVNRYSIRGSISYLRVYRQLRRFGLVGVRYGAMGYYSVSKSDRFRGYGKLYLLNRVRGDSNY